MNIGILDYGMGNTASVFNAVYSQGWDPIFVKNPIELDEISHLIIPGVGSYGSAMNLLAKKDLTTFINAFYCAGKPIMGICLGMQILSSFGVEGGKNNGLNLIKGNVQPLKRVEGLNIPHTGWNNISIKKDHPILEGIKKDVDFYFVHSYAFCVESDNNLFATCEYGETFTSIVGDKNVFGVQFHPEKSQKNGLKIIDNFCLWDGKC